MGGFGSGQWERWNVKTTVEECYFLDICSLLKEGGRGIRDLGSLAWNRPFNMHPLSLNFSTISSTNKEIILELSYQWENYWNQPGKKDVLLQVRLNPTRPHYGGNRWWFICPLQRGNIPCNRRVGKLYRPPGIKYFGCRHCHDLTYQSCRESHQLERLLKPTFLETHRKLDCDITVRDGLKLIHLFQYRE